jgi:hypothetical protein
MWPAILKMSAARLMTSTGYSSRESAPDGIFGNDSIHAMYVDKLDGKVDGVFFERMSVEWRAEQDRCLWEIERHQSARRVLPRRGDTDSRTGAERAAEPNARGLNSIRPGTSQRPRRRPELWWSCRANPRGARCAAAIRRRHDRNAGLLRDP